MAELVIFTNRIKNYQLTTPSVFKRVGLRVLSMHEGGKIYTFVINVDHKLF